MRAIIQTAFGPPEVLQLQDIARPVPRDHEVLVRIRASSVGFGDLMARDFPSVSPSAFHMPGLFWLIARLSFGLRRPRIPILGSEFSGEVEAVGASVTRFQPGDAVFGYLGPDMGAYAEYRCISADATIARKPDGLSHLEAASLPYGAIMAWSLLKRAPIQPGHRVLILGGSGKIGSAALQIAKQRGAEVTAVGGAGRQDLMRSLGADHVLDYAVDDFTRTGRTYDLIVDVLGKATFARCKPILAPEGRYLRVSFKTPQLLQMLWTAIRGGPRVICAIAPGSRADLEAVREWIEAGRLRAVVDRAFPLAQTADAHRYVASGAHGGAVGIEVDA